ncbi:MAG TPA: aromatic amino acid ammonia-lyase [Solirubrobacteraceae bacterium]|jgi:histidine ammonia-lyase|nr:aromatic amino acid ammonia-lyase [Solirubrobacteraceae bacterium]
MADERRVVVLGTEPLTPAAYVAVVHHDARVELGDPARIDARRAALEARLAAGDVIYSVNTGYGAEAGRAIAPDALARVQRDTVASHAVGVGPAVPEPVVRGALLLLAQAVAHGAPGHRRAIAIGLVDALNARRHPPVPSLGSNSASDLIPLAHLVLGLDLPPLEAKEASLLNTTAFTTALAFDAVRSAFAVVDGAERAAALTLQAVRGFPEAFDERLVALRPHAGALQTAAHMRALLAGSGLLHAAGRPHDAFSLRALPQVHGAVRDAISHASRALEIELSAVTDNPVVLEDGSVLSGALFHGAPIGLPLDGVALALGEIAAMSVARTRHLVAGTFGTPPKLTRDPQAHGLLMLPALASALLSEARVRASPASRESVPVDPMEDHVAMAALAARQAGEVADLVARVCAVELACAAQALDLGGDVAAASHPAQALHAAVRARLEFVDADRPLDTTVLLDLVSGG